MNVLCVEKRLLDNVVSPGYVEYTLATIKSRSTLARGVYSWKGSSMAQMVCFRTDWARQPCKVVSILHVWVTDRQDGNLSPVYQPMKLNLSPTYSPCLAFGPTHWYEVQSTNDWVNSVTVILLWAHFRTLKAIILSRMATLLHTRLWF